MKYLMIEDMPSCCGGQVICEFGFDGPDLMKDNWDYESGDLKKAIAIYDDDLKEAATKRIGFQIVNLNQYQRSRFHGLLTRNGFRAHTATRNPNSQNTVTCYYRDINAWNMKKSGTKTKTTKRKGN